MASKGKKGKKATWAPLGVEFVLNTVPAKNWSDDVEEEDFGGFSSRPRAPVVLPSASRAARGGLAVDDESIPRRPPYVAYISNLPYDVDETAISDLFAGLKIANLRLPREGDRLKGFGYVDFEDRESLIDAMNIPDLTISGRRIRIDVSTHENDRRMGTNRSGRSDRDRDYDPERTMGDWRSGPRSEPPADSRPRGATDRDRGGGGRDRERSDRDTSAVEDTRPGAWREAAPRDEAPRTAYGGRDSYGRDRDRGFGRDGDRDGERGRDGDRGYGSRDGGFRSEYRDSDRGYDRDRGGSRGFSDRSGGGSREYGNDRDRDPPRDSEPRQRTRLNLLPRTIPKDGETPSAEDAASPVDADKPKTVPAENVFGAAKPVDTAAKEREIEERIKKQEEEARKALEEENKEKDRSWNPRRGNDSSSDRRGGPRRNNDEARGPGGGGSYARAGSGGRESRETRDSRDERRDEKRDDRRDDKRDDRRRPEKEREPRREGEDDKRDDRRRPEKEREPRREGEEEKPLPKLKESEAPNFAASNKFSFLDEGEDSD